MTDKSKIEWTDATWNPVAGCTKCSPGCKNCYAEKMALRLRNMGIYPYHQHPDLEPITKRGWTGEIICNEDVIDQPLHWRKPRMIFVCSMSDLFHEKVQREFIAKVLDVCLSGYINRGHLFQFLTKRPRRMQQEFVVWSHIRNINMQGNDGFHLGVSVSTPDEKWKIETLCRIPAAVRFVSFEPLLADMGEILLTSNREDDTDLEEFGRHIDWVIVGGESINGQWPGRECRIEWVNSIVEQCKAAGVPCFVKQIHKNGRLIKMPKGYPQEYPAMERNI